MQTDTLTRAGKLFELIAARYANKLPPHVAAQVIDMAIEIQQKEELNDASYSIGNQGERELAANLPAHSDQQDRRNVSRRQTRIPRRP